MKTTSFFFLAAAVLPLAALAASPLLLPSGSATISPDSVEETRKSFAAVGKSLAEDIYAAAKEEGTAPDTGYDTATGLAWTTAQGLTFWGNAKNAAISEGGFTANGLTAYNLYNGRFYRLKGDLNISANRCILTVDGNTNAAVLSISEEITSLTPIPSPSREGSSQGWYSLDGRKLDGMPTKKGIYINGGRKVVIK